MLEYLILVAAAIYAINWLVGKDREPIKGIYRQKGKFYNLEYVAFWCILKLRSVRKANSTQSGEVAGYGVKSKPSIADMEQVQPLPDVKEHPMAVDAVYFAASNKDGYYLVTATARRQNGMIQVLTYLRIPDVGLFELPLHPNTLAPETEPMSFAAAGLSITPLEPMKRWNIKFNGPLRHSDTQKAHHVKFDLDWSAVGPFFDFDTDMNQWATCDSMAREIWSQEFFDILQKRHQTHHEQFGRTTGEVEIEGYGTFNIDIHGVRDHSYGNIREWRDLFRYGIQYLHLEDGTDIAVGNICMPKLLSRLTMGYVITPQGELSSISETTFEFEEWGDDGNPPDEMSFTFHAGGKKYDLTCSVVCSPVIYMRDKKSDGSWDIDGSDSDLCSHGARLHERMCKFKVNGIAGTGISEWCYENISRHQYLKK